MDYHAGSYRGPAQTMPAAAFRNHLQYSRGDMVEHLQEMWDTYRETIAI